MHFYGNYFVMRLIIIYSKLILLYNLMNKNYTFLNCWSIIHNLRRCLVNLKTFLSDSQFVLALQRLLHDIYLQLYSQI